MDFLKMEGCGNHFVLMERPPQSVRWPEASRRLLDPSLGIGGDGLMLVGPASSNMIPVEMFNPDGSAMGMCGNGIRCVALFARRLGLVAESGTAVFDVTGRRIACELNAGSERVRVDMGEPELEPARVPARFGARAPSYELRIPGRSFEIGLVSMGNPHCVIFAAQGDTSEISEIGPVIERHESFPERVNVELCRVESPQRVSVRVWERGAGLTKACGTGACAVVVAGALRGALDRSCAVSLPGGELEVEWSRSDNRVRLEGPAREVFSGRLSERLAGEIFG